jgi:hypothetical protein
MLLHNKFFNDRCCSNEMVAHMGGVSLEELNLLESYTLLILDFKLYIGEKAFQSYDENITACFLSNQKSDPWICREDELDQAQGMNSDRQSNEAQFIDTHMDNSMDDTSKNSSFRALKERQSDPIPESAEELNQMNGEIQFGENPFGSVSSNQMQALVDGHVKSDQFRMELPQNSQELQEAQNSVPRAASFLEFD